MFRVVIAEVKQQIHGLGAAGTFWCLLLLVAINYCWNVLHFGGQEVIDVVFPMKMLLISYNRIYYNADNTLVFIQLFPILAVLPAGFSLAKEQGSRQETLMIARIGRKRYYISRICSAFFTTALVMGAPMLIEFVLNIIAFPISATGDFSNWGLYEDAYIESVNHYLFAEIYMGHPYIYTVLGLIAYSVFSGVLGAFTAAISGFVRVKYKVFLFLPAYLLLQISGMISELFSGINYSTQWQDYILLFNDESKSIGFAVVFLSIVVVFTVIGALHGGKKDCI